MRAYLGSLVAVLSLIACAGSSDTGNPSGGGSSTGGTGSAGHDSGAGASAGGTAGKTSAGSSSGGDSSSAGSNSAGTSTAGRDGTSGSGVGGTVSASGSGNGGGNGGGSGGARTVDARCPALRPTGACNADDAGLACQYDNVSGCLCYPNAPGTLTPCQKVNPTCQSTTAPTPAGGAGGASGKIAPPPLQSCNCSAATWTCHF